MKREALHHPKLKKLAQRLGVNLNESRGICVALWGVTSVNFPRGDIGRISNEDIAVAIDYAEDSDTLINTLIACGLLDRAEQRAVRLYIHDWHEHADGLTHRRLARAGHNFANGTPPNLQLCTPAERQAYAAARTVATEDAGVHSPNTRRTPAVSEPAPGSAPGPEPEPGIAPGTATAAATNGRTPNEHDDSQQHAAADTGPVLLTFPCAPGERNGPRSWDLRQSLVDEWRPLYPLIDVPKVCRYALEWAKSHPRNRRPPDEMRAWLSGTWLKAEQESAAACPKTNGRAQAPRGRRE